MLTRRFAAACCLTTLAGLIAAALVAEGPARSWEIGKVVPCVSELGVTCLPRMDAETLTNTKDPR